MGNFQNLPSTSDKISVCVNLDIPCLIWGPPGSGKSSMVANIAKKLGVPFYTLMGNILDPTDISGPREKVTFDDDPGKNYSRGCEPSWVHMFRNPEKPGILFIDELCTCSIAVQNALLRIVLERKVGDVDIYCRVVAATNYSGDTLGNHPLQPALGNRFLHLDMSSDGWAQWLRGLRTNWMGEEIRSFDGAVADDPALLSKYTNLLADYASTKRSVERFGDGTRYPRFTKDLWPTNATWPTPQEEEINRPEDYAYPTRRSLYSAIRVLAYLDGSRIGGLPLMKQLVVGLIGSSVGTDLAAYVDKMAKQMFVLREHIDDFETAFDLTKLGPAGESSFRSVMNEFDIIPEARRRAVYNHLMAELDKPGFGQLKIIHAREINALSERFA